MAGTYSQLYIQVVFAVKGRANLIHASWKDELYSYISGIITEKGHKSIIVNGYTDHVHCFIGLKPAMALSDLVRDVKNSSSKFINSKGWVGGKFQWQEGFGAFSYGHSALDNVIAYIQNQKEHHKRIRFKDEYKTFLNKFQIEYKDEYLFDWLENDRNKMN